MSRESHRPDILAVGALAGIGFTVSLLIGDLAFGADPARRDHVVIGVLAGSLISGIVGGVLVMMRRGRARTVDASP